MSLILDALKRAERERADGAPSIAEPSLPLPRAARKQRRWGLIALIAVLVVGGALGWKAWRGKKPRPAPQAVVARPAPAPTIMARPAPPPAPTVVPGTEAVASLDDLTDETTPDETAPPMPAPVPALPVPAAPVTAPPDGRIHTAPAPTAAPAPVTPSEPGPEPSTQPSTQPSQPAAVTPSEPVEIPPALTQQAPLRKFREMPPDYRADFPQLKIEIHVYEKNPAQRFVMVNGHKYREGERMAEGPALIEIVPDGIVLEYRGERLLYTLNR